MKIGIYDPYLDTLGGGERYALTLAEFLAARNDVEIFWDDETIKQAIEERLNISMKKIKFIENIFAPNKNLISKLLLTRRYDLIFFLSDGSIPTIFSKKSILHFQVPFSHTFGQSTSNRLKISRFQWIICNSQFTKKIIDKTYGVKSLVIYPPVDIKNLRPQTKKNIILSVGKFSKTLHSKKHEVMIDIFKELSPKLNGWELILAGGLSPDNSVYLKELKEMVGKFPIKILANILFTELRSLYGQAKIYWHAAGFGENEEKNPEKMEHFGITTVEAMAAGCVPVVFAGGGQKEIVEHKLNGFLWRSEAELAKQTIGLLRNEEIQQKMSMSAQRRSENFSKEKFYDAFSKIICQ